MESGETEACMISFVVPAHNEQLLIARTLRSIHDAASAASVPYEIVVVDDASTDQTAQIARGQGAKVVRSERRQIAAARNAGACEALRNENCDVLVFLDADTTLPAGTLRAALDSLECGAVGGGAAVAFDGKVPRWAEIMLAVLLFVFRLLRWSGGCFIYCRRSAFEATGGWNEGVYAGEEMYMCQALKHIGRFVILREQVITSGRKVRAHSAREILTTLARLGLRGPSSVRNRKDLGLWYKRRADSDGHPGSSRVEKQPISHFSIATVPNTSYDSS